VLFSADEFYADDVTSGPVPDAVDGPCPHCGADAGESCRPACLDPTDM
jgi:hypothetical protein